MHEKTLYRTIDVLLNAKSGPVEIQFFGGEPLLRLDLIKNALAYARRISKLKAIDINFSINTNGILLDRKTLEFLTRNKFYVLFSVNHAIINSTKNLAAKITHNKIIKNLSLLIKKHKNHRIYFLVSPQNVDLIGRDLEYLYKTGIKEILLNYEVGVTWPKTTIEKLFNKIQIFMQKIHSRDFLVNSRTWQENRIISPEFAVDCDGKIFFMGGLLLEEEFPELRNNFYFGHVDTIANLDEICKNPKDIENILLNTYHKNSRPYKILTSNLGIYQQEKRLFIHT